MIYIQENLALSESTKPIICPICGYKRLFEVPSKACVRKSQRGNLPQSEITLLIKCKRCNRIFGITIE